MEQSRKEAKKDLIIIAQNNVDFLQAQQKASAQLKTIQVHQASVDTQITTLDTKMNNVADATNNLSALMTKMLQQMNSMSDKIDRLEKNNSTQTQEKELYSPSNNLVPPSNPSPEDMNLVEINRKRSQQGSPTTPPITKKTTRQRTHHARHG